MRCFLFIPGDSERKIEKAQGIDVDALILDLEDAVAPERRDIARGLTAEFVADRDNAWVRINPWQSPDSAADLEAVMAAGPAGIVLPKPASVNDVHALVTALDELESKHGIEHGRTRIMSLCTEKVSALFSLDEYSSVGERLYGLSWGAEDLAAELGATTNRDERGQWLPPYEMARNLCLFAAHAAEVAAIDTVFTDFRNEQGLREFTGRAVRDGFSGMLAIHPAQVEVIQQGFTPSDIDIEHARKVIALFDDNPGEGVLALDGKMLDRPHYVNAKRVIQRAGQQKGEGDVGALSGQ